VFHLEVRQFPHTVVRFNQSEQQMRAIAIPWAREEWVEVGERKWNSNQAKLTILEGPQLSMPQLAMSRGWRNAQRLGEDVTERVLEPLKQTSVAGAPAAEPDARAAGAGVGEGAQGATAAAGADLGLLADSLGLEILALLDDGPVPPARVWGVAQERLPGGTAAESLGLGEAAIRSLLARRLVVLRHFGAGERSAEGANAAARDVGAGEIESLLRAAESWAGGEQSPRVVICRA
jgi:hypothetical protein